MTGLTEQKQWFAIRTKYRGEKYVQNLLARKDIEVYLPLKNYTRHYASKIKHYKVPLLPCFVFVYIDKKEYIPVLETPYVAGFVRIGREILPVKEEEMHILRSIEGLGLDITISEEPFTPGQEVFINQGPLYGLKGVITRVQSKDKFRVSLETLPFSIVMEIDKKSISHCMSQSAALV